MNNSHLLSPKKLALARLMRYIGFICIIVMFFLPIFRMESTEKLFGHELTLVAHMSPYQFLRGETTIIPEFVLPANSDEKAFMDALVEWTEYEIDFIEEWTDIPSDDDLFVFIRYSSIAAGVFMALVALAANSYNMKAFNTKTTQGWDSELNNHMYIISVYVNLPKLLTAIECFFYGNVLFESFFLGIFGAVARFDSLADWRINWFFLLGCLIFVVMGINGVFQKLICAKDINTINMTNARFDNPRVLIPKISSDLAIMASLFTNSDKGKSNFADGDIETLQKYKKMLDEGIITEEEFKAKKKELLNLDIQVPQENQDK